MFPVRSTRGNDDNMTLLLCSGCQRVNGGHLAFAILDFWISTKLQQSTKIKQKVIKTNKETLISAETKSYKKKSNFSSFEKGIFHIFLKKKTSLAKIDCHGNIKVDVC